MVKRRLVGILLLTLGPAAWAAEPAKVNSKPKKKSGLETAIRAAAADLIASFGRGSAEPFLQNIDGDTFPNFLDFRENVRDFLTHNRQINTDIIIDKVLYSGDKAAVQLRWFQSYQDEAGERQKDNGRCEFILRRLLSGKWVLTAIHGSSPFS